MEPSESHELTQAEQFDALIERSLLMQDGWIEYNLPFPKSVFLNHVVSRGFLLHGSGNADVIEFEPRQANDSEKEFGNKIAVYAVNDPILPIFYAIQDREQLSGQINSGKYADEETGEAKYHFAVEASALEKYPWKDGVVYIMPPDGFEEGKNNEGELMGEFANETPVQAKLKLRVSPEDFPYLDSVKPILG